MNELLCVICHEDYKNTDEIHSTSCGHIFHAQCIQQWKSRSSYCPQCRFDHPSSHRIYINLDNSKIAEKDQKLQEMNLKLEQSLIKVNELEQQLQDSELNFLNLQGQYNQQDDNLKELNVKNEYLSLQNESREKELTLKADEVNKLQETIRDYQKSRGEKLKEASQVLAKKFRNSAELVVGKVKSPSILNQIKYVKPLLSNPSATNAKSAVLQGITYLWRPQN